MAQGRRGLGRILYLDLSSFKGSTPGGIKQWLWRAVDEHRAVLDILLQKHRDTEAAKSFFIHLLVEYHVPEAIHTDKLWRYSSAIRELPVLHRVEHV